MAFDFLDKPFEFVGTWLLPTSFIAATVPHPTRIHQLKMNEWFVDDYSFDAIRILLYSGDFHRENDAEVEDEVRVRLLLGG